jgi:hypothetical protein
MNEELKRDLARMHEILRTHTGERPAPRDERFKALLECAHTVLVLKETMDGETRQSLIAGAIAFAEAALPDLPYESSADHYVPPSEHDEMGQTKP